MNFTLRLAKVLGNPDESGWSQIHQFTPNDPKKLQNRGSIFCLITLHYKKEEVTQTIERVAFGREVISRIHEEYYGKTKNTPFTALKNAVGKVSEEFSDDVLEKLEIGAISVVENVIYAAVCGGSSILIYRDGILAEIISKEKDKENLQGVVSASGYPKSEDVLIIANNNFLENVPKGTLKASVQSKDIAEASESLAPKIHAVDESGTNACIFIYFEEGYEQVSQITAAYEKEPTKDSFEAEKPDKKFIGSLMDKLPKKRLYIRKEMGDLEDMQRRKVAASVGLILLVLLGSSIFFWRKTKKTK